MEIVDIQSYYWKVCNNSCHCVVFMVFHSTQILTCSCTHSVRFVHSYIFMFDFMLGLSEQAPLTIIPSADSMFVSYFFCRSILFFLTKNYYLAGYSNLGCSYFLSWFWIHHSVLCWISQFLLIDLQLHSQVLLCRALGASLSQLYCFSLLGMLNSLTILGHWENCFIFWFGILNACTTWMTISFSRIKKFLLHFMKCVFMPLPSPLLLCPWFICLAS